MPVSLERLIAEVEPNVITEKMTRDCIQIIGGNPDNVEDKKRTIALRDVECLAYSFQSIARIDNLLGLDGLTKLQLDNNQITTIECIGHLTNLTWLDLSFNKISKIEGLETLVKLQDLSLYSNEIETIENLDTLTKLHVFSIGCNQLKKLDNVNYLRQFRNLRLVNLAGNPICKEHDYRSYVLSHIKDLTYLDYRRVAGEDVHAAMEQHQDEMIELQEQEETAAAAERADADKAVEMGRMKEANLDGVDSLLDDMVAEDPEWAKFVQVPTLTDGWHDVRDKFSTARDEFKATILEQHGKKKAEHEEWLAAVQGLLAEKDAKARELILDYERIKKRVSRAIAADPNDTGLLSHPKVRLITLKDELLDIEIETVDVLGDLVQEFDRNFSEVAEANKAHYSAFFTQVRDLQNNFFATFSVTANALFEKYNQEDSDVGSLPDDAVTLLADKEVMLNSLQTSHDAHTAKIDALEDRLVTSEIRGANELGHSNAMWAAKRNRDRISEIINYIERNMLELEELAGDEDDMA